MISFGIPRRHVLRQRRTTFFSEVSSFRELKTKRKKTDFGGKKKSHGLRTYTENHAEKKMGYNFR